MTRWYFVQRHGLALMAAAIVVAFVTVCGALSIAPSQAERDSSSAQTIQLAQFVPCPNGSCKVLAPDKEP